MQIRGVQKPTGNLKKEKPELLKNLCSSILVFKAIHTNTKVIKTSIEVSTSIPLDMKRVNSVYFRQKT